ncbi:unannotated protein [freshwater metagenome]|uniref:Unannotated protein n=1 Tax=freshwater metagenome TaxID=449393 RepID=A0A6J6AV75_9ZZZZ
MLVTDAVELEITFGSRTNTLDRGADLVIPEALEASKA